MKYDCVIIGSGIAGMTAAITLKRANKNVLMIEKTAPGGAINAASTVKNYPGLEKVVSGPEFSEIIFKQTRDLGIETLFDTVLDIKVENDKKIIVLKSHEVECDYILIATGKENRKLNLPLEDKLTGHGVSYCALCDAPLFKGKDVAVIGTGDSAVEEALYLNDVCKSVTILAKYNYFKCQDHLLKALNESNINVLYEAMTDSLIEDNGKLSGITYKQNDEIKELKVDGLFVYIGSSPNIFANLGLELDKNFIKVNENMETSVPGIYAAGDIVKKPVYQLLTAASDGLIAATAIIKAINTK